MGGEPVQQQIGHRVGLLVEDPVRDAFEDLEAILAEVLHDEKIKPEVRLAGLLVLLYAQWPAAISRLTVDHIHAGDERVRIRLGDEPVVLPEPVAALALAVVANRQPGNAPPQATGPTTPPKSAAEHTAKERHSDSCNI